AGSSVPSTGNYPIERREGEIERLRMQAAAIEFDAGVMLDRIGVSSGWRCLDLGCGPGGILELLSVRAGPTGQVIALDADPVFLEHARVLARDRGRGNIEFVQGDAYNTGLPRGSFDFVHVRFVASTVGRHQDLIGEAVALACPGGIVALQEPDISTLKCYPRHAAWDRLTQVLDQVFVSVGNDVRLAQHLYQLVRGAGLENVQYRPFLVGFRSDDRMADYLPATVESVRRTILRHDLIDEEELNAALAACRRHLADPDTVSTYVTVAQVWGRRPRLSTAPNP
ncbi:MAG: class I SAM-dependent methyltransferase, partial [Pseudomonadota bacterium]